MFSSHSCPAIRRPFLRFLLSLQKNHLVHSNTYQNFPQTFIRPVLCLTFVQLRQYCRQHGKKACTAAYKVGNRFRPEHAVCSQAIHRRQQDRQRYHDHYLSEQRKKGGLFCLPSATNTLCPVNCNAIKQKPKSKYEGRELPFSRSPGSLLKIRIKNSGSSFRIPPACQGIDHTDSCNKFNCFLTLSYAFSP